jgi:beta-glucosidase/6-phospho-beta-glucosidase/beta-galactosidase
MKFVGYKPKKKRQLTAYNLTRSRLPLTTVPGNNTPPASDYYKHYSSNVTSFAEVDFSPIRS